jgi:hypothetical protein
MKKALSILLVLAFPLSMLGQNLEVVGKLKVKTVDDDPTTDSLLVLQADGSIGKRHVSSIANSTGVWAQLADTTWTMKRVGIGTSSPVAKLNVIGDAGDPLLSGSTSNGILRLEGPSVIGYLDIGKKASGSNDAWLQSGYNATADALSLNPRGGNVGIGLLAPSEKLHVAGNLKVAGIISGVSDPVAAQDAATKAYVDAAGTYSVGDFAQGGIVFWVDETGQHGLICAKSDQSGGKRWYAGTYGFSQARGDGLYSGEANTNVIVATHVAIGDDQSFSDHAALICFILQITEGGTTYGDWYLPSKYELNLMYDNKATIDATALANEGEAFSPTYYWSSLEVSFETAWGQNFNTGTQLNRFLKEELLRVRAIRAF